MSSEASEARSVVHVDNERVRVTGWYFAAGAATGFHQHELDYVVVPLSSETLHLISTAGKATEAFLKLGRPYFR